MCGVLRKHGRDGTDMKKLPILEACGDVGNDSLSRLNHRLPACNSLGGGHFVCGSWDGHSPSGVYFILVLLAASVGFAQHAAIFVLLPLSVSNM